MENEKVAEQNDSRKSSHTNDIYGRYDVVAVAVLLKKGVRRECNNRSEKNRSAFGPLAGVCTCVIYISFFIHHSGF